MAWPPPPFSDLVDSWIADKRVRSRRGLSESTERAYKTDLTQCAICLSGPIEHVGHETLADRQAAILDQITPTHLTDGNLKTVFQKMIEDEMSPASRARLLSSLRGLCKWRLALFNRLELLVMPVTMPSSSPSGARARSKRNRL